MIRTVQVAVLLLTAGCDVDIRPDLTDTQFAEIVKNCSLSDDVRLEREGRDNPMIVLTNAGVTSNQVECIRAEQSRLGATADMAN